MELTHKARLCFIAFLMILSSTAPGSSTWVGSKYQIECEMCAACDNPCNQPSPPPPTPSPPPPSPPPATPTNNCPPPPSPPSGGGTPYYSPPPPSQGTYTYPPPSGVIGSYYPPPATYKGGPTPPPPNPIVPYFPFYFHTPPPPSISVKLSVNYGTTLVFIFFLCFI